MTISKKIKKNTWVNASTFVVRVNNTGNPCMEGRIEHLLSGDVQQYRSIMEFIHLIRQKLEETGFPQPATKIRTWKEGRVKNMAGGLSMEKRDNTEQQISLGGSTFLVRIQFQQNTSWQGTIQWLDGKQTKSFRSLLELILLINDTMEKSGSSEEGLGMRYWEDKEEVS